MVVVDLVLEVVWRVILFPDVRRVGTERGLRVRERLEVAIAISERELRNANALGEGKLRRSGPSAFGRDEDDAVRRLGSIDRRRRRALQDLDALDVVRVEISDTVDWTLLTSGVDATATRSRNGDPYL